VHNFYPSLRNNTHCSELHQLFNSRLQTHIQAVGYCLNKHKGIKTRALVYFLVTIAKSIGSSSGCKVVQPCISVINRCTHWLSLSCLRLWDGK